MLSFHALAIEPIDISEALLLYSLALFMLYAIENTTDYYSSSQWSMFGDFRLTVPKSQPVLRIAKCDSCQNWHFIRKVPIFSIRFYYFLDSR